MAKQLIGEKKRKACEQIIGEPVTSGWMNGTELGHNIVQAWTGQFQAYLVNLKTRQFHLHIRNGRYVSCPGHDALPVRE